MCAKRGLYRRRTRRRDEDRQKMSSLLGKHLHDQPVLLGWMATSPGLLKTLFAQDFIEFHKILCCQPGREELLPD